MMYHNKVILQTTRCVHCNVSKSNLKFSNTLHNTNKNQKTFPDGNKQISQTNNVASVGNAVKSTQKVQLVTNFPTKDLETSNSPADRATKKHVYLPYRGAIPFWFYLVP